MAIIALLYLNPFRATGLFLEPPENISAEAVGRRCSVKKMFLKISQNAQENTCARACFLITMQAEACDLIKKETLAQVFSYEFCEIFKRPFL